MYLIYDTNGSIVGNQAGYKSYKSAQAQTNRGKIFSLLNEAFYKKYGNPPYSDSGIGQLFVKIKVI